MLVVGLSGGIASGKSTVSRLLQDAGIPLVDLDVLARQAVEPGTSALAAIASFFGPDVLHPDGTLNREALGSIVFHDEAKRKKLNGIVHPAVRRLMAKEVVRHWLTGQPLCVVDAPLLIEAGLWRYCGRIVLVYCSEQLQLQRLKARNALPHDAAAARIASQAPLSSKLPYADHVIDNSGTLAELEASTAQVVAKLRRRTGWTWRLSWLFPPYGLVRGLLLLFYRLFIQRVGSPKRGKASKKRR